MSNDVRRQDPHPVTHSAADPDDGATVPRPLGLLIVAVIEAWVCAIAGIRASNTIENFQSMLKGFGSELPDSTSIVIATRYGWALFSIAAIALLVWIGVRPNVTRLELRRKKLALTWLAVLFGLALGFTIYALYLPIFRLGAVV
jgi:type II secretory pathway component PulF